MIVCLQWALAEWGRQKGISRNRDGSYWAACIQEEIPLAQLAICTLNRGTKQHTDEKILTCFSSITNICHEMTRIKDGSSWHTSISTSEKIWSVPLTHFICQPHHLRRPTENASAGLTRSKADGVAHCWNAAVCKGTPGNDWTGERGQWEGTERGGPGREQ